MEQERRKLVWRRRMLAAAFPGAFLLQKRCKCRLHVYGDGPQAEVLAEPCARCRRYEWIRAQHARLGLMAGLSRADQGAA